VAFHYRGYHRSTGSPSARALLADAPLVFDAAVAQVRPSRTIAAGFSIGSGVAASLAPHQKLGGLILVTRFDSLKAVAAETFPWWPIRRLFKHEIEAAGDLESSHVPVGIVAAGRDEVISGTRTNALRTRVPHLVFDGTIERASHNDLYAQAAFDQAMRDALAAVTAS
jgi:pimeloyl-ACP methyl ester carboxylesterase